MIIHKNENDAFFEFWDKVRNDSNYFKSSVTRGFLIGMGLFLILFITFVLVWFFSDGFHEKIKLTKSNRNVIYWLFLGGIVFSAGFSWLRASFLKEMNEQTYQEYKGKKNKKKQEATSVKL